MSRGKKYIFGLIAVAIIIVAVVTGSELIIRIFAPQAVLFPRWNYSRQYGSILPENTVIKNYRPGRWSFIYSTNEYGCRGAAVPVSNGYDKENIIILGDSFSFGYGVNDGDEYASVMAARLKDDYNVINLSVGGWGLTQQLRKYYEFGQLYHPKIVLLQFCGNDLIDNLVNKVTVIKDGKFSFRDTDQRQGFFSGGLISRSSLIQNSQLYCFIRSYFSDRIYEEREAKEDRLNRETPPPHEKLYRDLLTLFARDLHRKGIKLIMYGPEDGVYLFPLIKKTVSQLQAEGLLIYLEVAPWFENVDDFGSPEGHSWGKKAHRIVGDRLAEYIRANEPSGAPHLSPAPGQ